MPKRFVTTDIAARISLVTVEWVALYELNVLFLSAFEHSERASWIFVPAALRVIAVLLFGWAGAAGLVIGAFLTLPHRHLADVAFEITMALTSGAAPLLALAACRRIMKIPGSLAELRLKPVIAVSIATAAFNSALVNAGMALHGRWQGDLGQIGTILVGDILGAALVLALITLMIRLAKTLSKPFTPGL